MPDEKEPSTVAVVARELEGLRIDALQRRCKPQRGTPWSMRWGRFVSALATPRIGDDKAEAGGIAIGKYIDAIRHKRNMVITHAVSLDFDCNGVSEISHALARYSAVVHETFSSTDAAPRCRAFVLLSGPIDAVAYERLHTIMRAKLRVAGLPVDESAKDCSRLCYLPVRRGGVSYSFRLVEGDPLDWRAVLAANPPPSPRPPPRLPDPAHADRYVAGALRRAAQAVMRAAPGERHGVLCRESFALARLAVDEPAIRAALLEPFVSVAGEHRRLEGERSIGDCVRARRGLQ
jgi:hypothetical protein